MGMPHMQVLLNDPVSDLCAYVVVDSVCGGRAMGGTRMTKDVDLAEVADLAHAMTLKLALADLPIGGAKAGITCGLPPGAERDARIAEFGRAVAPLLRGGIYLGADQGITHRDRDLFFDAAGFDVRQSAVPNLPIDWSGLWERCHDITGFGVCEAICAAVETLDRRDAWRTVAIQGFGLVGRAVARILSERGYQIVAVADLHGAVVAENGVLPLDDLLAVTDSTGAIDRDRLPAGAVAVSGEDAWLDVDADILVLAAGGDALRVDNLDRLRAELVVEGGNLACTSEAADILAGRAVPVLPGIVANCGGAAVTGLLLLGQAAEIATADELVDWLFSEIGRRIRSNIMLMLARAATDKRALDRLAIELAEEKLAKRAAMTPPTQRRPEVAPVHSDHVLASAG